MKSKITLFVLSVFIVFNVNAQHVWAPSGAKWIHSIYSFSGNGYIESKVDGDSLIQGVMCKKIYARSGASIFGKPQEDTVYKLSGLTFSRNDSVFYGDAAATMQMIYVFGLQKGDTFSYHYPSLASACYHDSTFQLVIDSVGVLNQYGTNLSFYDCRFADTSLNKNNMNGYPRIVERLGADFGYFSPSSSCLVDETYPSICYYEDDSTQHNAQQYANCKKLFTLIECPDNSFVGFNIYPNPVINAFTIQPGEFKPYAYLLLDVKGAVIAKSPLHTGSQIIDIADLQPGVYTLRLVCDGNVFNKRIVLAR